jgi:hypothetical protein
MVARDPAVESDSEAAVGFAIVLVSLSLLTGSLDSGSRCVLRVDRWRLDGSREVIHSNVAEALWVADSDDD